MDRQISYSMYCRMHIPCNASNLQAIKHMINSMTRKNRQKFFAAPIELRKQIYRDIIYYQINSRDVVNEFRL